MFKIGGHVCVMVVANDRRPAGAVMRVASLTNWGLGTDKGAGAPLRSIAVHQARIVHKQFYYQSLDVLLS